MAPSILLPVTKRPTWQQWLDDLDPVTRQAAVALRDTFQGCGADDPESWARSEISENIAQLGRYTFLRCVWREVEAWRDGDRVGQFLPDASPETVEAAKGVVAHVAFEVALNLMMVLDDEEDIAATEPHLPGWRLTESSDNGDPTGRQIGGLHESFLQVDPRGIEAEDIRGW
jgi:hypothetical protein